MPTNGIQLVCFDLGRVMVQIVDNWAEACVRAGVPLPINVADPAVQAEIERLCILNEIGRLDDSGFNAATAALLGLSAAQVAGVSAAWLKCPTTGIEDLIAWLRAKGYKTACLSNTNAYHWQIMHTPGPAKLPMELLDFRFASHLMGLRKPDSAIYRQVERDTGLPGSSIVFFDDLLPNVAAACELGWRAYRVDPAIGDAVPQMIEHLRGIGIV